jgi:hypothetical protein
VILFFFLNWSLLFLHEGDKTVSTTGLYITSNLIVVRRVPIKKSKKKEMKERKRKGEREEIGMR